MIVYNDSPIFEKQKLPVCLKSLRLTTANLSSQVQSRQFPPFLLAWVCLYSAQPSAEYKSSRSPDQSIKYFLCRKKSVFCEIMWRNSITYNEVLWVQVEATVLAFPKFHLFCKTHTPQATIRAISQHLLSIGACFFSVLHPPPLPPPLPPPPLHPACRVDQWGSSWASTINQSLSAICPQSQPITALRQLVHEKCGLCGWMRGWWEVV